MLFYERYAEVQVAVYVSLRKPYYFSLRYCVVFVLIMVRV
jgi:hypothetical protein